MPLCYPKSSVGWWPWSVVGTYQKRWHLRWRPTGAFYVASRNVSARWRASARAHVRTTTATSSGFTIHPATSRQQTPDLTRIWNLRDAKQVQETRNSTKADEIWHRGCRQSWSIEKLNHTSHSLVPLRKQLLLSLPTSFYTCRTDELKSIARSTSQSRTYDSYNSRSVW